jgi:hypothetical protein
MRYSKIFSKQPDLNSEIFFVFHFRPQRPKNNIHKVAGQVPSYEITSKGH